MAGGPSPFFIDSTSIEAGDHVTCLIDSPLHLRRVGASKAMTDSRERCIFFIIVGPGGGGKNTLIEEVLKIYPEITDVVTATSRDTRAGEVNGVDYHFVSPGRFQEMIDQNLLIEWQEITPGNYYGVPRAEVEPYLSTGRDVIADIDVLGAHALQHEYPGATVLIFVTVPGATLGEKLAVLEARMRERNEKEDIIRKRLARAETLEFPFEPECDHVVINDEIPGAVQHLAEIIRVARLQSVHS